MDDWALLDSTCARVESVMRGYLHLSISNRFCIWRHVKIGTDVRVMDSSPPPAPASACAMLSPCWAVEDAGIGSSDLVSIFVADMLMDESNCLRL